jgi:hypothetical protein
MRKLRLRTETLRVESFEAMPPDEGRGTVLGHVSNICTGAQITCDGVANTCNHAATCGGVTCGVNTCYNCQPTYTCVTNDPLQCTDPSQVATCQIGCVY